VGERGEEMIIVDSKYYRKLNQWGYIYNKNTKRFECEQADYLYTVERKTGEHTSWLLTSSTVEVPIMGLTKAYRYEVVDREPQLPNSWWYVK
jgi:hypothetical protein